MDEQGIRDSRPRGPDAPESGDPSVWDLQSWLSVTFVANSLIFGAICLVSGTVGMFHPDQRLWSIPLVLVGAGLLVLLIVRVRRELKRRND
jgi:hypothetical protein